MIALLGSPLFWLALVAAAVALIPLATGLVYIRDREVGIVVKRYAAFSLPPGRLVATAGEAGLQAATLPPGVHFGLWWWQFDVRRVPFVVIPQGRIGLVVAADGASIPPERILGRTVPCDNFQDAKAFLAGGGEKGRQLGLLTAGAYRINTAMFTVVTQDEAGRPLEVHSIEPDMVGIVTTLDGAPIQSGEIAGPVIPGHDNFQNAQEFIRAGGRRGLQEQVLLSGSWNLNPWFVRVEEVPMTHVPIGHVGVVISYVGKAHLDVSGEDFKHGDLVPVGHKGVWVAPLYPGKHPLNTAVMKVECVPTTNIVLNWAGRTEAHNYDAKLSSITVRSRDGFAFSLDVSQIIHVGAPDAPKVISRVGSMQNLVDHVLQPIVGNYFRNAAQHHTVLDFLGDRSERQREAGRHIREALGAYDVQAIDTLIGDINPPAQLMATLTDRKIAEEQKKTFEVQEAAQKQRQQLVRETANADIQGELVRADQGVRIAELQTAARVKEALGEAEAIRATGTARADSHRAGVEALGALGYTQLQLMQVIGERGVRIVPDVSVTGGAAPTGGLSAGLLDGVLATTLQRRTASAACAANGQRSHAEDAADLAASATGA
jgi:uncharacterized membrane protein YqiK